MRAIWPTIPRRGLMSVQIWSLSVSKTNKRSNNTVERDAVNARAG